MAEEADPSEAVPPVVVDGEVPVSAEEQEHAEEEQENVENEAPKEEPPPFVPACSTLCPLYGEGAFPARELCPNMPISRFIATCWPDQPPKGAEWLTSMTMCFQ